MSVITKEKIIDQITITENGTILYREVNKIIENDIILSQTYHRTSLIPSQDLTDIPEKVKQICELVWTEEVINNYKKIFELNK